MLGKADAGTYFEVEVTKPENLDVVLYLDMEVRYTTAHNMVEETVGQAAIERGPLVYCCEGVDVDAETDVYKRQHHGDVLILSVRQQQS